ncbi:MAG TPA: 50S ribosomal protein L25 [Dehalococcoidales bacterium]|nr:50S ribosomal protein L25 [Dehalococcoidales bacterium]
MENLTLRVSNRDVLGKKTRFLRREGITPVHLFGHNLNSLALQCDTAQLQQLIAQAGMTKLLNLEIENEKQPKSVFIREIQRQPSTGALIHVDFYQIRKSEKIKIEVPIVLTGEAPAMKLKGRSLMQTLNSLSIECLPDKIPPQLEVDLSSLEEANQAIHVRDITLGSGITINTDPDQLVVKITEAVAEKVVEEVVAEEVEEVKAEAEEEGQTTE